MGRSSREERRALAEDDRVDDQVVFVDEAALDELGGERRSADFEVAIELGLDRRELLAHVAAWSAGC